MTDPDPRTIARLKAAAFQALRNPADPAAIPAVRALVDAQPGHPDHWYNLAFVLRCHGDYRDAAAAYRRAIASGLTGAHDAWVNIAVIQHEFLNDADGARASLSRALAIAPDFVPALLNLGQWQEDVGDLVDAAQQYRAALRADPGNSRALARLAELEPHSAEHRRAIDQALAAPTITPDERAELTFGLAEGHDRRGEVDEAFATFARANAMAEGARDGADRYDPAAEEHRIAQIIALQPPPAAPVASVDARILFICGMVRSGSTLLEQMLGCHPAIRRGGELDILPRLIAREPRLANDAPAEAVRQMGVAYRAEVASLLRPGQMLTDKRLDNILSVGLILDALPEARVIITRRAAMDNIWSIFRLNFAADMRFSSDLNHIAHWYALCQRLADHWTARDPARVHLVDYDRLVQDPAREIGAALDFLGLPFDSACLRAHEDRTPVRTPSAAQVRQPVYTASSGRWRKYEQHLAAHRRQWIDRGLIGEDA